jgi:hypothetical protein
LYTKREEIIRFINDLGELDVSWKNKNW